MVDVLWWVENEGFMKFNTWLDKKKVPFKNKRVKPKVYECEYNKLGEINASRSWDVCLEYLKREKHFKELIKKHKIKPKSLSRNDNENKNLQLMKSINGSIIEESRSDKEVIF